VTGLDFLCFFLFSFVSSLGARHIYMFWDSAKGNLQHAACVSARVLCRD